MNCIICKNGETEPGKVKVHLPLPSGGDLIVNNVPADVCSNCGEYYTNIRTTKKLEAMVKNAVSQGVSLEVLQMIA
jgi:YgiT-type zinc finger domain-containing protein